MNSARKTLLVAILDELIPPSQDGRIPGAGALGVADFLPSATSYAPDPAGAVDAVLDAVLAHGGDFEALDSAAKVAVLQEVEREFPDAFAVLVRLTYMGYYSRPDIRPLFGVGAHPVHPGGYVVQRESAELMDELTAPVRARGPIYRDPVRSGDEEVKA